VRDLVLFQKRKPCRIEVRPVPRLEGYREVPGNPADERGQLLEKGFLVWHFLTVEILEFEDDGANLAFDGREPFEEVAEKLGREESGVRFHAAALVRERDVLRGLYHKGEALIHRGRVFLDFPKRRDLIEP
jgi:hypothetical protein